MDGSMGRLIFDMGVPRDTALWSARALVDEQYHSVVVEAHAQYIRAGSKMITTNNYGVQPQYYRKAFGDEWEKHARTSTATAVRLAREARTQCGAEGSVRILGCLPPICESHRPDLTAKMMETDGREFCVNFYRMTVEELIAGGVDALIAETMNNWTEVELVLEAVGQRMPLIVSMEGALRSDDMTPMPAQRAPEVAKQVLAAVAAGSKIEALGFNCASPEHILAALVALKDAGLTEELRKAGVQLATYANINDNQELYDTGFDLEKFAEKVKDRRKDLVGSGHLVWCNRFMAAGATYCGGCCGTVPDQIRELAESLKSSEKA